MKTASGAQPAAQPPRGSRRRSTFNWLRRVGGIAATLAVSAAVLWLALRAVSFAEIGRTLRRANPFYLLPIAATFALQYWLIALRWKHLVRHIGEVSVRDALPRVILATSATAILPFLLDQALMVQISARTFGIGRAELSGAEFIERLMEGFVYALFLLVTILVLSVGPAFLGLAVFMLFGTAAGFALVLWLTRPSAARRPLPWGIARWFDVDVWWPTLRGLGSIRNPRQARDIFLLTVAIAFTEVVFYGLVGLALDIHTNPVTYFFLESAGNIGSAIPFTQGGTGSIFVVQSAFQAAGQSGSVAAAYALALQTLITAPILLLGPVAAWIMRLTPQEVFALRIKTDQHQHDEHGK